MLGQEGAGLVPVGGASAEWAGFGREGAGLVSHLWWVGSGVGLYVGVAKAFGGGA